MSDQEKEIREKIAKEISYNLTVALENCTCMDAQSALNPGPLGMKTTYVERMHEMIISNIKGEK